MRTCSSRSASTRTPTSSFSSLRSAALRRQTGIRFHRRGQVCGCVLQFETFALLSQNVRGSRRRGLQGASDEPYEQQRDPHSCTSDTFRRGPTPRRGQVRPQRVAMGRSVRRANQQNSRASRRGSVHRRLRGALGGDTLPGRASYCRGPAFLGKAPHLKISALVNAIEDGRYGVGSQTASPPEADRSLIHKTAGQSRYRQPFLRTCTTPEILRQ